MSLEPKNSQPMNSITSICPKNVSYICPALFSALTKHHPNTMIQFLVGGWTNPSEKIWVKMGSSSPGIGVKTTKYLEPPPILLGSRTLIDRYPWMLLLPGLFTLDKIKPMEVVGDQVVVGPVFHRRFVSVRIWVTWRSECCWDSLFVGAGDVSKRIDKGSWATKNHSEWFHLNIDIYANMQVHFGWLPSKKNNGVFSLLSWFQWYRDEINTADAKKPTKVWMVWDDWGNHGTIFPLQGGPLPVTNGVTTPISIFKHGYNPRETHL